MEAKLADESAVAKEWGLAAQLTLSTDDADGGGGNSDDPAHSQPAPLPDPAFQRELATAMGFPSVAALAARVDLGRSARRALVTHNVGLARSIAQGLHNKINAVDKGMLSVGWCRLTVSKPVLKAPMVSAVETKIS